MATYFGMGPDRESVERWVRTTLRSGLALNGPYENVLEQIHGTSKGLGLGVLPNLKLEAGADMIIKRASCTGVVMGFEIDVTVSLSPFKDA